MVSYQNDVGTAKLEKVVIRFAGDSGDGMQLTGDRFTHEAAAFGNDLATQPNFPAEIRAPQGTLPRATSRTCWWR
jgi:2-oxoglutarate ferredoxin oxidoreductase subunit alpha